MHPYALQLGLPSFVEASPEKLRVYPRQRKEVQLEYQGPTGDLAQHSETFRGLLMRLRS